jgi:cellulose synthase/poly-beta-1,6-N-acetylglucosamine synthase-like glycosyltransferase
MQFALTALEFIGQRSLAELVSLFWFVILFDIPRYFLGFLAVFFTTAMTTRPEPSVWNGKVSVLIAGHNEGRRFERCIRSLRAQSCTGLQIICVDDGSTDESLGVLKRLKTQGLIDAALHVRDRGGKSAALNYAASVADGDVFVVVDCDCVFQSDAIERLVRPFADPDVGATSGAVLVRNHDVSIMTSLQAIEYLFSIHLGRTLADYFGIVTCVSGAMGAFRRTDWQDVGGMDVGPGEDFDLTLRLRQRDRKIRFVSDAVCWTNVPETLLAFLRQRRRWERDAARLRLSKFAFTFNPFDNRFRAVEASHQLEFVLYSMIAALAFLAYCTWLMTIAPLLLPLVLFITTVAIVVLDAITLFLAAHFLGRYDYLRLMPFVLIFAPFQFLIMRNARLFAYFEEMILSTSRQDNFVPEKVRRYSPWH